MSNLIASLLNDSWAIRPEFYETTLSQIMQGQEPEKFLESVHTGEAPEHGAFFMGGSQGLPYKQVGSNAFISVSGTMFPKPNWMTWAGYGTASTTTQTALKMADKNPEIKKIYMLFSTGGGLVSGTEDSAQAVKDCQTPVTAYIESMACSAGYWVASACDEIVVSSTGIVGNIGVIQTMMDNSAMLEKYGMKKFEFVSSQSPNKRPDPSTADGKEKIQMVVDDLAKVFIDDVKASRPSANIDGVAGDVLVGARAVKEGFADRVASLDSILDSGTLTEFRNSSAQAEDNSEASSAQNLNPETEETMTTETDKQADNQLDLLARLEALEASNADLVQANAELTSTASSAQAELTRQAEAAQAAHLAKVTAQVEELGSLPEALKAGAISASVDNPAVLDSLLALQAVIDADTTASPEGHGASNDEPEDDYRKSLQAAVNAGIEGTGVQK